MRKQRHRERLRKLPVVSVRWKERDGWVDQSTMMLPEILMMIPSEYGNKILLCSPC